VGGIDKELHDKTHRDQQVRNVIANGLTHLRETSALQQLIAKHTVLQHRFNKDYTEKDVSNATKQLKNNKTNGTDGVPGEEYKALTGKLKKTNYAYT